MFSFGFQLNWELNVTNTKINLLADFGFDPSPSAEVSAVCWLVSEVEHLNRWMGMTDHIFIQFMQRM